MNLRGIKIKQLRFEEISEVEKIAPENFNINISDFISMHIGSEYFYPIVAKLNNQILGYANMIINGNSGWIGNFIVHDEFPQTELIESLLRRLIDYSYNRVLSNTLLFCSFKSEAFYKKLGFRKSHEYQILIGKKLEFDGDKNIRRIKKSDMEEIYKIDKEITGENRSSLLSNYYSNAFLYEKKKKILGYFLPEFENGPIIAMDKDAGSQLLLFKHSIQDIPAFIPSANSFAINTLVENGFEIKSVSSRLFMGREVIWKPQNIYSRTSSYCG